MGSRVLLADGCGLRADLIDQCLNPWAQRGQVALHDVPDQLEVDAEVLVDELVPHARDLPRRDLWIKRPGLLRHPFDRLAEHLDVADDGILGLAVGEEGVATVLGLFEDRVERVNRVKQLGPVVFHNSTASERIRSRM